MRRLATFVLSAVVPWTSSPAQEPGPAKVDFQQQIAPLLLARCIDCHGPKEQKGDLRLDAKAHLFPVGDEAEWSVVPGKPDDSDLLRRLGLPADDDDVMPAKGETLDKEQQALFRRWIAEGAEWPAAGDEWLAKEIAAAVIPKITFELPPIDEAQRAAIATAVAALQKLGAVVQPVAADTEALDVNLSLLRDKVGVAEFQLLVPLAPRLVWLNVSRTAIDDSVVVGLNGLRELRRLHAANTKLADAAFQAAATLPHLEYVNAYGTALGDAGLAALAKAPKLQRIYAWQSKVTAEGGKAALQAQPRLQLDLGDYVEARLAAAQKEIDDRAARNKPVNEMCPVATDKKVDPAHTLDHDGRRIGFCCAKCKAAFQKEPAKYLANLPAK